MGPVFMGNVRRYNARFRSMCKGVITGASYGGKGVRIRMRIPTGAATIVILPRGRRMRRINSNMCSCRCSARADLIMREFDVSDALNRVITRPLTIRVFGRVTPKVLRKPVVRFTCKVALSRLLNTTPRTEPVCRTIIGTLGRGRGRGR